MFASAVTGYGLIRRTGNRVQNANSRTKKSTEKLASLLRINCAGDDAAGLAISEKMKAECTLLRTAQKNAKDGISLVQTAEGALQEIHDMLNRLVELADQSANGTYVSSDRSKLQSEVEQLKKEIDRIAKLVNFNGQKLIDGSLDGDIPNEQSNDLNEVIAQSINYGSKVAGALENKVAARSIDSGGAAAVSESGISAHSDDGLGITSRDAGGADGADAPVLHKGDNVVLKKTESTKGQAEEYTPAKIAGDIGDLSDLRDGHYVEINGVKFEFDTNNKYGSGNVQVYIAGKNKNEIASALKNAISSNETIKTSMGLDSGDSLVCDITDDGKITLTQAGDITPGTVTEEMQEALDGKTFEVQAGDLSGSNEPITGKLVRKGRKKVLELTVTREALKDGRKINLGFGSGNDVELEIRVVDDINLITNTLGSVAVINRVMDGWKGTLYVSDKNDKWAEIWQEDGELGFAISKTLDALKNENCGDYLAMASPSADRNKVTITINETPGTSMPTATPEFDNDKEQVEPPPAFNKSEPDSNETAKIVAGKKAKAVYTINTKELQDGDIIKIADTIFELDSDGTTTTGNEVIALDADVAANFMNAINALNTGDSDYTYTFGTPDSNGVLTLTIEAKTLPTDETQETEMEILSNITRQSSKPPDESDESDKPATPPKKGKALRLQIGEGDIGAVYVSLEDMSVKGLNIDGVDIGTQDGAADAIDTLRSAINKVSRNRGTLGALTNRLEHACNSLGISYENTTDAETKISGADVAQEMMQHTKNQIIGQAAQSMLAQAMNLKRQSVQQLLSL